ncbi:MAG: phosphopantetheine-binding protein [Lachnospiraceae bacterium]|nr:phosphopantetheine-binding protein [Lachnospiraceae bacterium]
MSTLTDILMEIDDSINYEKEKALIDDRLLDSFAVISLIGELEETFEIQIEASQIIPDNFNSVEAMEAMIRRLQGMD